MNNGLQHDAKWISDQGTSGGISKWSNLMQPAWQREANRLQEASPLVWMPIVWTNFPQGRWPVCCTGKIQHVDLLHQDIPGNILRATFLSEL
jgi:hypothetical protein